MNGTISILLAVKNAFVLCSFFYLPGLAWAWLFPARSRLELCGTALAIGLPLLLLPAILLAEFALFTSASLWLWAGLAIALGLITGGLTNKNRCIPCFRNGFTGFYILIAALSLLFALPNRGEWLAGGWDPGVNINQGLLLARTGRVAQPPDLTRARALREAPGSFARKLDNFTEVFPGLPADPQTGAITPYFYRATPTLVAICDLLAGRTAALRVNHLAALFAVALFAALLAAAQLPARAVFLGVLALALQPILIAHTAIPASEMTSLALVCATGLALLRPERRAAPLLALLLLLGALNRSSFLFYQAFLLLILAAWDASESDRKRVTLRHLAVAIALLAGLSWYAWVAPTSLYKTRHLYPLLIQLTVGALAITLILDVALLLLRHALPRWTRFLSLLLPLALLAREFTLHAPWAEFAGNFSAWFAYATPAIAALGIIGLIWRCSRTPLAPWLLWLFATLLTVLLHRHAANLYPWATKRWLAFSPPLLASGIGLLAVGPKWPPRALGKIAVVFVAVAVILALPLARAAWRNTEYNGMRGAMDTVAASLDQNDLVITDHFLWGTPLALAYGRTVLSAEALLTGRADAAQAARMLAGTGKRVVLVSSDEKGLARWPDEFKSAQPLIEPFELHTRTIIQHRSHRMFDTRDRAFTFQTYVWHPLP